MITKLKKSFHLPQFYFIDVIDGGRCSYEN